MDPATLYCLILAIWTIIYGGGRILYHNKVILPRRRESSRLVLESMNAELLAIETKQAQDAALTLEDKIWLFDMGRTEWTPEDELGFIPEFDGSNTCISFEQNYTFGSIRKAYFWNLPDWYVDFLSTRPFHSDLGKRFYDWACEGKDVKTHIAELKQERDKRIAKEKADEKEKKRRWREHEEKMQRIEQERLAKAKADRLERERREREERREAALALEKKRRSNLGLTGTWVDDIINVYRSDPDYVWTEVSEGRRIVRYAPGTKNYIAVKQLQHTFDLPVTGYVDADTLREIEVQWDVAKLVRKRPLRVTSDRQRLAISS